MFNTVQDRLKKSFQNGGRTACNCGIARATGEFICLLDVDRSVDTDVRTPTAAHRK